MSPEFTPARTNRPLNPAGSAPQAPESLELKQKIFARKVGEGKLGKKSGQGFYGW